MRVLVRNSEYEKGSRSLDDLSLGYLDTVHGSVGTTKLDHRQVSFDCQDVSIANCDNQLSIATIAPIAIFEGYSSAANQ